MNIFSSFIHSTEDAHVLPCISTREECYSFPTGWGTSGVNASVFFSFHLIRWTNQFYWLVLLPDNGKCLLWEMPVACVHAGWSYMTILHIIGPLWGAFKGTKDREGKESLTFSIFSGCKCFAVSTVLKSSQCGLMFQLHSLTQLYQSRSSLTKLIFRSLYISQHPFSTGKDLDGRKGVCLTLQISNIMRYKTCKSAALK